MYGAQIWRNNFKDKESMSKHLGTNLEAPEPVKVNQIGQIGFNKSKHIRFDLVQLLDAHEVHVLVIGEGKSSGWGVIGQWWQ